MTTQRTEAPGSPAPGSPRSAAKPPHSARSVANARRRQRLVEVWTEFRKSPSGLFGLIFLIIVILLAILAPVIADRSLLDVTQIDNAANEPPSMQNPLGTDPSGRSVLVMLLWGSRVSLMVGVAATAMSMVIGTVVGMAAGHFGGLGGALLMRVVDFFLVLPSLVLAIVLSSVLQRGVWTIVIAIGITSWAGTARVVRSQTLTIESRSYIERSLALGAGHRHIIGRHVLPAVMPLVMANTTLTVGAAIIAESTLSFLGLGDTTQTSWGSMLKLSMDSGAATGGYWWFVLPPGLAIVVVVLAFTLVGRAFESVINPTLRGR
ncbi:ABC transporter permease [Saxibacter everestensis]|uniref:ABC transporter permease n=1 Tax=Saxibacter everestensis TaxID=2909229 RepID=A0ABY8QVD0_9MICO|nr:ABC transporter permease [Brevibacteriaceae bacterium ZFBP1038]